MATASSPCFETSTDSNLQEGNHVYLKSIQEPLVYTVAATRVPLATMINSLFPSLTYTHVDDILRVLRHNGNIKDEGWTAFEPLCSHKSSKAGMGSYYEPRHSPKNKDITFKSLEQVFEQIQQACASVQNGVPDNDLPKGGRNSSTGETPLVKLSIHGHKNLAGDWSNSTRPDGSIHLQKSSLPWPRAKKQDPGGAYYVIDYADICLLIETKLRLTQENRNSNQSKLLWNAHHKLRCDPRCRFVTGITIENTQMQFWLFDRSGIFVSTPFNFMLHPIKLIKILLAYILAPSEASLGFDPTIRCTEIAKMYSGIDPKPDEDGARTYEITIHDSASGTTTKFRTIRCLANFGAVGICGRGTRVWEVAKTDEPDLTHTCVLKDVWIDADRTIEGDRLESIRAHALPEELPFFLKLECHGVVMIEGAGLAQEDRTFNFLGSSVPNAHSLLMQYAQPASPLPTAANTSAGSGSRASASASSRATGDSHRSSSTNSRVTAKSQPSSGSGGSSGARQRFTTASKGAYTVSDEPPLAPPVASGHRRHYRVAFADSPGRAIKDLTTPELAFEALHGGLNAMKAMLRQNLMHRDISAGNILLVEREGETTGVLMDLEYTKEFPGNSATPHTVRTGTKQYMAVEVLKLAYRFQPRRRKPYKLGWSHSPLHDVESTWWITIWILYHLTEIELDDDDKSHRAKLFSMANPQDRDDFFCLYTTGSGFLDKLPVAVSDILADWRMALIDFYEEQQQDLEHGSHELFDYEKAITDAIGRIDGIRSALIDPPP